VAAWLEATPATFRFSVKAGLPWLTGPYRAFGERLGTVLVRAPDTLKRDDAKLAAFLAAWPHDLPLTVELRDPSWQVDETVAALAAAGAALCASEDPDEPPPTLRRTAPLLYLRLRRHDYTPDEIATWADRLAPFLAAGDDAFVFFRHDEVGRGPELALELMAAVEARGRGGGVSAGS
jgi:uncharacterized protein YecE (DUF72 family)